MGLSSLCDGVAAGLAKVSHWAIHSVSIVGGSFEMVDNRLVEGQECRNDGHGPNQ